MRQTTAWLARVAALASITMLPCASAWGRTIAVDDDGPAEFGSIQAGIDAAEYGDTVSVAAGTYYENVVLKDGVEVVGAGADVTIIDANGYGDVVNASANGAVIRGFTLTNSGQSDLGHTNCGIYVDGHNAPVVRDNLIVGNGFGIGLWYGGAADVRNNIIEGNMHGMYLYGSTDDPTDPNIVNNVIADNQMYGIVLRQMVSPLIVNNIIVGHAAGINSNYVTGSPTLRYNDLWDSEANYVRNERVDDTLAGPGSLSVDPCFARRGFWADANDPNVSLPEGSEEHTVRIGGDYHLLSEAGRYDPIAGSWIQDDVTSACIDAGDPNDPVAFEPSPNGAVINLGAYGGTRQASKSPSGLHGRYGGGTGEPNDPYLLYTPEQMNAIGADPENWDKHFKLMADIDLRQYQGDEFRLIDEFSGVFDGDGHTISNLTYQDHPADSGGPCGLFRFVTGTIKNLRLADPNVVVPAGTDVGALVGRLQGGMLVNCHVDGGQVSGSTSTGGLVGCNALGRIADCHAGTNVSGHSDVGGLLGSNMSHSSVFRCCAKGTVNGTVCIGGLVGVNVGRILDCYASAEVTGTTMVGGLAGSKTNGCAPGSVGTIVHSYSAGPVSGDRDVGGLLGWSSFQEAVVGSLWDIETSGQTNSAGGEGRTTAEMQTAGTFLEAGWDFVGETANGTEEIWWIDEGQDYPRLWWEIADQ